MITEPFCKNTCAAIASVSNLSKSENLLVMASDHIWDNDLFEKAGFNKDTYLSSKFFCNHKNENKRVTDLLKLNDSLKVSFKIYDLNKEVNIKYEGILPDLFAEGQGVVMTGKLINENTFIANEVLAKHDENYMPPEVADMMKEKEGSIYKNDN